MCCQVADLEAHAGHGPSDLLKDELSQSLEELEALLKAKDEVGAGRAASLAALPLRRRLSSSLFFFFFCSSALRRSTSCRARRPTTTRWSTPGTRPSTGCGYEGRNWEGWVTFRGVHPWFTPSLLPQETEIRNSELERRIQNSEQSLHHSLEERDRMDAEIQRAIEILDIKIFDLNDLRQSLFKLINK